jgi:DNA-binding GntR family transcriptional regulator
MDMEEHREEGLNASVYAELRRRLMTGRMTPGFELSTRSIAAELGVSQTPVRDALSRLAAEGAVSIRSKRRVRVPAMTQERFDDLLGCRLVLEPEAAIVALPYLTAKHVEALRAADAALDKAIVDDDAEAYMSANYQFHFVLYSAAPRPALLQLIETVWIQFGPFMRVVHGRVGNENLYDNHKAAIEAIIAKDAVALREAITRDIADGMDLIKRTGLVAVMGGVAD